jgi:hypothetical protein
MIRSRTMVIFRDDETASSWWTNSKVVGTARPAQLPELQYRNEMDKLSTLIDATTASRMFLSAPAAPVPQRPDPRSGDQYSTPKLSARRHHTLLRPHQGRHSAAPLRRACRRRCRRSLVGQRRFRLQLFLIPLSEARSECERGHEQQDTTYNDAKMGPPRNAQHRPAEYAGWADVAHALGL